MLAITADLIAQLESKAKRNANGCLEWPCGKKTYPQFELNKKVYRITRMIAAFYHGLNYDNPKHLACHHCDNPRCIEKDHLYAGSHHDNSTDAIRRGRYVVNGKTTHCPRGHFYNKKNTSYATHKNGVRHKRCVTCHRDETREYQRKRRKFFKKVYGTTKPKKRNKKLEQGE